MVRVHHLAPKDEWSERFQQINDFEELLYQQNRTHMIKFFLHISKEEQFERFKQRLDDPARNWKISESDYQERELWSRYVKAYEDVFAKTSTERAPWYVIPSNHKWFRNLAVSRIVVDTMKDLGMRLPKPTVDLEAIRKEYHGSGRGVGNADQRQADLDGIAVAIEGSVGVTEWDATPAASVGVTSVLQPRPGRYSFSLPRTMMFDRRHGFLRSSICKSPSLLITSCAAGYNTPALFFWS